MITIKSFKSINYEGSQGRVNTYTGSTESDAAGNSNTTAYFVGLNWQDIFNADDRIGFAFTQPLAATEVQGGGPTGEVDPQVWELYYSFRPNDSMEIISFASPSIILVNFFVRIFTL